MLILLPRLTHTRGDNVLDFFRFIVDGGSPPHARGRTLCDSRHLTPFTTRKSPNPFGCRQDPGVPLTALRAPPRRVRYAHAARTTGALIGAEVGTTALEAGRSPGRGRGTGMRRQPGDRAGRRIRVTTLG